MLTQEHPASVCALLNEPEHPKTNEYVPTETLVLTFLSYQSYSVQCRISYLIFKINLTILFDISYMHLLMN